MMLYQKYMAKLLIGLLICVIFIFSKNSTDSPTINNVVIHSNCNHSKQTQQELDNILSPLWSVSDEQLLIEPKTIIKTLKFMIEERDETDPELVEFVRSLIIPPVKPASEIKLNIVETKMVDYSQAGQSSFIDKLLGEKKNGFFIEAGAFDGETMSNSLFFERNRGWTGILIEPIPTSFKVLKAKNRNAYMLNACIARGKPIISKFRLLGVLTGRVKEMKPQHQRRMDVESGTNVAKLGYFPCFSLKTIMKAIGVSHVDYFSLDVEGGEVDVLKSINFKELDITTFSIEHNGFEDAKKEIISIMESNGYRTEKIDGQDSYHKKI